MTVHSVFGPGRVYIKDHIDPVLVPKMGGVGTGSADQVRYQGLKRKKLQNKLNTNQRDALAELNSSRVESMSAETSEVKFRASDHNGNTVITVISADQTRSGNYLINIPAAAGRSAKTISISANALGAVMEDRCLDNEMKILGLKPEEA